MFSSFPHYWHKYNRKGVDKKVNPSGVYNVPQPNSYTLIPSIPDNTPDNSDGELLNIPGKSIVDYDKIHQKWTPYYYKHHTKIIIY